MPTKKTNKAKQNPQQISQNPQDLAQKLTQNSLDSASSKASKNLILSIESSCDDSSLALTDIDTYALIYHRKISQERAHNLYGGVVPEIASRLHCESLPLVLADMKAFLSGGGEISRESDSCENDLCEDLRGKNPFGAIRAIAITTQPGLSVSLLQGLMMAKTLCASLNVPIISVNHLIGHFYSLFIGKSYATMPMSVLLVSGGHTQILEANRADEFVVVASSKDDSFGECFDKVAKMLNLGYPGGSIIEQYAKKHEKIAKSKEANAKNSLNQGDDLCDLSPLPLPLKSSKELAFSFSGLKNATRLLIQSFLDSHASGATSDTKSSTRTKSSLDFASSHTSSPARTLDRENILSEREIAHICASFQEAAISHICDKLTRYFVQKLEQNQPVQTLGIVGGASANLALRSAILDICERYGANLILAPLEFCSDNAAMIGRAGIEEYLAGNFSDVNSLEISPRNECPHLKIMT
ncbi:tRNA (adenosine(37)-N6)-threonylcarbamoyltransferase complex transferase subunit TsaD [Helicobacter macacae]|uniref:tRNA N6-adenosine threonylcarbamoyltransferase n=1 Tax=Helicobacter macacae MIT 99-5501 TaxID=1357400 RepID=V8CDF3_9HELI|nr:tRNA (adenosine(37)-N6)-threonylcarbamoyltransferase complex transferase subunit TsaD [Helicobacter macacae]ETD25035.1 hypothetical protein HMPREF2086_00370 [Helicobacter macacae MIT 99-5501]